MQTIIVDDELLACKMLEHLLADYPDIKVMKCFTRSSEALEYVKTHKVDLAFLDVEMPGMSGVSLARSFRKEDPFLQVVFVTAYSEYSLDAWEAEAVDYLLKPINPRQIERAVSRAVKLSMDKTVPRLFMRCFPSFEMLVEGVPYSFRNKKARELLAYLVHSRGNWCLNNDLAYILFEDRDEVAAKNYLRQVVFRLRKDLKELELDHIFISDYGRCRIDTSAFQCDYYDYLNGENSLFKGEYLREYPWADSTTAYMSQM